MKQHRILTCSAAVLASSLLAGCGTSTNGTGNAGRTVTTVLHSAPATNSASGQATSATRTASAAPSVVSKPGPPISNMCDLLKPKEAASALGAPVDAPASSGAEACAYISTAPASGATDNADLSFGLDTFYGTGRRAFDKTRAQLQIPDVSGVGDAAILEDNKNGTGKLIFIKGDRIFDIEVSTGVSTQPVTGLLVAVGKLMAARA